MVKRLRERPLPKDVPLSYDLLASHLSELFGVLVRASFLQLEVVKRNLWGRDVTLISFIEEVEGAPVDPSRLPPPLGRSVERKPVREPFCGPPVPGVEDIAERQAANFTTPAEAFRLGKEAMERALFNERSPIDGCYAVLAEFNPKRCRFTEENHYVRTDSIESPVDTCWQALWGGAAMASKYDKKHRLLVRVILISSHLRMDVFPATSQTVRQRKRRLAMIISSLAKEFGAEPLKQLLIATKCAVPADLTSESTVPVPL